MGDQRPEFPVPPTGRAGAPCVRPAGIRLVTRELSGLARQRQAIRGSVESGTLTIQDTRHAEDYASSLPASINIREPLNTTTAAPTPVSTSPPPTPTTPGVNMPARTGRPWQRRKARIIRRDGGICHLCGNPGADTADHLLPYSQGGTDDDTNLAAAHQRCNRIRGDRPIDTARNELNGTTSGWDW